MSYIPSTPEGQRGEVRKSSEKTILMQISGKNTFTLSVLKGCSNILLIIFISFLIEVANKLQKVSYIGLAVNGSKGS
jgi:hypothetical protein